MKAFSFSDSQDAVEGTWPWLVELKCPFEKQLTVWQEEIGKDSK